jgi:hypothetical protein
MFTEKLKDYEQAYPLPSPEVKAHLSLVEKQRKLRIAPSVPFDEFIKVEISKPAPTFMCGKTRYSIIHEIGVLDENGNFSFKGYISKKGFQKNKPSAEEWIWAADSSPWVSLREIFPEGGKIKVGIKSFSVIKSAYFYSQIEAFISSEKERNAQTRHILFMNEIEAHRELLQFEINLK